MSDPEITGTPYLIGRAVEGEAKFSLKAWSQCEVRGLGGEEKEVCRFSVYEHTADHVKTLLLHTGGAQTHHCH